MLDRDSDVYKLLYTNEVDELIGLSEVQLLETPLLDRIPPLRKLLEAEDVYIAYQAAKILTAWGDSLGLKKIDHFIDAETGDKMEFSPHRITGEDNFYDELADAVSIYFGATGDTSNTLRIFRKLLTLYPLHFFQGHLKYALLARPFPELATDLIAALKSSLTSGRIYQASQLLPPIAQISPGDAWELIPIFIDAEPSVPDPAANVAEALKYIRSEESKALARKYLLHNGPGVSNEAKRTLAVLEV